MGVSDQGPSIQKTFPQFPSYVVLATSTLYSTKAVKKNFHVRFWRSSSSTQKTKCRVSMIECAVFVLLSPYPYNKTKLFRLHGEMLCCSKISMMRMDGVSFFEWQNF